MIIDFKNQLLEKMNQIDEMKEDEVKSILKEIVRTHGKLNANYYAKGHRIHILLNKNFCYITDYHEELERQKLQFRENNKSF